MKDEQIPVHQLDHAEPTVIHHPEEDMTILARWLQHGMKQGLQFWLLIGGVVVVLLAIAGLSGGLMGAKADGSEAWVELTQAKGAEDKLKIAEAHPNTPVAGWARIDAAEEEYTNGINDLTSPGKKELAGPRLKKALDLFEQVAKEAPKDSTQQIAATFGAARALEARNELPEAIAKYRDLANRFPNAPEAQAGPRTRQGPRRAGQRDLLQRTVRLQSPLERLDRARRDRRTGRIGRIGRPRALPSPG